MVEIATLLYVSCCLPELACENHKQSEQLFPENFNHSNILNSLNSLSF